MAAATKVQSMSLGTINALAPIVFTAAQIELPDLSIQAQVEHGPTLISQVHEGLLDAAIVTIADQHVLPNGVQATQLGASPLVLVLPDGSPPLRQGRQALVGCEVLYSTIDLAGEQVHAGLSRAGAFPRLGPTIEATLRIARYRKVPALVPQLAARWWHMPSDRIVRAPLTSTVTLSLVTRPPQPSSLGRALPGLTSRILGDAAFQQDDTDPHEGQLT